MSKRSERAARALEKVERYRGKIITYLQDSTRAKGSVVGADMTDREIDRMCRANPQESGLIKQAALAVVLELRQNLHKAAAS